MASLLNMSGGGLLEKGLPYDAEIEYLQGAMGAYINTGIKGTSDIRYEGRIDLSGIQEGSCAILGSRIANKDRSTTIYIYSKANSNKWYEHGWGWRYGNEEKGSYFAQLSSVFDFSNISTARTLIVNNVSISCSSASFNNDLDIYVFGMNANGHVSQGNNTIYFKYISLKIYNGTTLVRDYIPVRIGTTGYLYDKVSGQLFGNAGTGNFILGNDI